MGAYLNPGTQNFQMAVNSEIFVDKTEMLQQLNRVVNTQQRYVSVSRPRRFGKTMAVDMICAYYDREADSRGLFEQRRLSTCKPAAAEARELQWDKYLGAFDVLRIVMTDFMEGSNCADDVLKCLTEEVTGELMDAHPEISFDRRLRLRTIMNRLYGVTERQFVIVIDEWDAIFRTWQEDESGQKQYLDFLRDWLKDKPYVALAYMTGILPIKKYGRHSALNMFVEYSMMQAMELAPFTGFTGTEVRALCDQYEMSYEDISNWYDGYVISNSIPVSKRKLYRRGDYIDNRFRIYSPLSVVNAMRSGIIKNYWNKTETYEALAGYIRKDYDGLKDAVALLMDGGRLRIDTSTYQNDMTTFTGRDDVLSLLVHLGYLGFDDEYNEVFIPNREILDEFRASTKGEEWTGAFQAFEASVNLLEATWKMEADKVAELVEDAHNQANNKTYNDETALSYGIQLAYYAAQKYYTKILELDTGKGYADIIYLPSPEYNGMPALLIELKYGKSADAALDQIRKQKYLDRFEHYKGNTLVIGINYDKDIPNTRPEFKYHSCMIEKA